jgi:hypothetical protein
MKHLGYTRVVDLLAQGFLFFGGMECKPCGGEGGADNVQIITFITPQPISSVILDAGKPEMPEKVP